MVNIIYHRDLCRVSIEGHALSGEAGHDLVCASVSALAYTLAAFVENLHAVGQVQSRRVELSEGDALIKCSPPKRYKSSVILVFDAICGGLELLARDHPENVSYEIR